MLVIHNARIHTLNPSQPLGAAIVIDHGEIIAIGTDEELLTSFSASNRFDATGHAIIPGLHDAHIHLEKFALSLQKINCETDTLEECLQRVADRVKTTLPGEWILGHGWNQNNWREGYGSASLLDKIAVYHPVYLTHKSLHSGWANSLALRLANITRDTPDPAGGKIGHLQDGDPDGILFESAKNILEQVIPEPGVEEITQAFRTTLPQLWRLGLTGLHDFDRDRCFAALQVLHNNNELKLRVVKSIPGEGLSDAVALGLRSGFGDEFLRIGSLKLFADGALGPHTAAMLKPYEDDPSDLGILMVDADNLFEQGRVAVEHGISLAIHAIGDRANREVLNVYARLRKYEQKIPGSKQTPLRHRIEHVQVIHPDDIKRLSELDIIASMQPIHATSDMLMANRYWGSRAALSYAWRSQLTHGATLAFGSDAPVESPNPFWGIHAAVTRRRHDGTPSSDGWYPEQRLSVGEAIRGYTTGPAFAAGMEDKLGILAPGYLADLLVLSDDPFTCDPEALMNIEPLATMIGGDWVYTAK